MTTASRVVARLLLLAAALTPIACGDDPDDRTDGPPAATSQKPGLAGTWVTAEGGAEVVYVFERDRSYKRAEVLLQPREAGLFKFTIATRGTFELDGSRLVIRPTSGTQEIQDPDRPSSSSKEPADLSVERFDWRLDSSGTRLQLTDAKGSTSTYVRQ